MTFIIKSSIFITMENNLTGDEIKAKLIQTYGEVMTTAEMTAKYEVIGFLAPFVSVRRKSDGVEGTLEFTHLPRFYFNFIQS